jgi:dipeptidyl aminopeptidase/acylaminoacyl peptidase
VVFWFWVVVSVLAVPPVAFGLLLAAAYLYCRSRYLGTVERIFQERPLFIIPRGKPAADAEPVSLKTADGLTLRGCYFRTPAPARKGVILFGLEFGSDRWACQPYCTALRDAGYDVFAYEPRNQGESEKDPRYEPLQWVTDRDLADMRAAVKYLLTRPDADPRGIGVFGISKGGSTALLAAATERGVRCVATDGAYATYTTVVPYMQRWIKIYSDRTWLQKRCPAWLYGFVGGVGVNRVARTRGVTYPSVEKAATKLRQPLLMIHGEADTYIKPEMARALFDRAREPKELWLVPKAKHNQALTVAGDEYHRRLVAFFDAHLGG